MNHSETNCAARAAGICGRLHVGDSVEVTYPGNVGTGHVGEIIAQPTTSGYTVHFPEDLGIEAHGVFFNDLTYSEAELELVSA
jgi:hypothetical protein